jgi:hypothetical protein
LQLERDGDVGALDVAFEGGLDDACLLAAAAAGDGGHGERRAAGDGPHDLP